MKKRQEPGKRPDGMRLVLVPNHDIQSPNLTDDRPYWEGSQGLHRAETAIQEQMAQSWGVLVAVRLEQAGLLPHHLTHDQNGMSGIVSRSIADRARTYPVEDARPVIGPRAKPKRKKGRLRSEGLLPRTSGPTHPQSGIIRRKIAPETWSGLIEFLIRLETADTVGVLVADPGLIRQLTEALSRFLDPLKPSAMQDPSFTALTLPTDCGRLLRKQARLRPHLTAQGRP